MRIIGGQDYYDSAMAYGQDTSIVFVRGDRALRPDDVVALGIPFFTFGANFRRRDHNPRRHRGTGAPGWYTYLAHVVIAGKAYSGLKITVFEPGSHTIHSQHVDYWFWDLASLEAFLEARDVVLAPTPVWSCNYADHHRALTRADPKDFFGAKELSPATIDKLVSDRITVLSWTPGDFGPDGRSWRVDQPTLKAMEFFRVLPPPVAFQEIAMWKCGVLGADGPTPVQITDDKVKIAKHGFDVRSSFRREKKAAR